MKNKRKILFIAILSAIAISVIAFIGFNNLKPTPYEELCENGYTGTEDELLDSLSEEDEAFSDFDENTKSAYDKATENGYKGSKNDWLEVLTGDRNNANKYNTGISVYDIAVQIGFTGTKEEWLESLKKPSDKNHNTITADTTETTTNLADKENSMVSDRETTTEKNEFTVTFKNYKGEVIKTELVKRNDTATPPTTPEREGYIFLGWDRTFNNVCSDIIVNPMFEKLTKPTIVIDRVDTKAGEKKVAVTVSVANNPGITSLNLQVSYDKMLTLNNVKYNNDIKGQAMKPGNEESPFTLAWVSPFENVKGDWTFATLYFDVSEDAKGDLPIYITYDMDNIYNMEEENIYFDIVNGAIAITK